VRRAQSKCGATNAGKHEDRLCQDWERQERDRGECEECAQDPADRRLSDSAPERNTPHQEPRDHRSTNCAGECKSEGAEVILDVTAWQRCVGDHGAKDRQRDRGECSDNPS
jgi:hypothetical protein